MATRNFTPKEIAWIVTLPMKRYRMGSTVKQGYFDAETGRVFMVDENGELTGETATPVQKPERKLTEEDSSDQPISAKTEEDSASDKKAGKKKAKGKKAAAHAKTDDTGSGDKKKLNKTINIVGGILGGIVLVGAVVLYIMPSGGNRKAPQPVESPVIEATASPTSTPEPTPTGMMEVEVIQAVGDILKGQAISMDYVEKVSVSMQEYNQLVAMGSTPCKWEELATIDGMYANSFIAAGSYISDYYLTVADPIPVNPWADGSQTFTVGMDAVQGTEKPFFGAQVVLKVTKTIDTTAEGAEAAPDLSWPEDSETPNPYASITMDETAVSDTVVQRVFTVTSAIVSDLLDANGNSLFSKFVPYVDMPTVNRMAAVSAIAKDPDALASMTPSTIVIKLTPEEMTAIGSLTNATATITVNGNADASSDVKYSIAWGTQSIMETLFPVTPDNALASAATTADNASGAAISVPPTEQPEASATDASGDTAATDVPAGS